MVLIFSLRSFFLNSTFFSFLYDLLINKVRKLKVAVWNPIMENNPVSFSVFRLEFLYSFSFTFYLSYSLSSLSMSYS